MLHRRGPDKEGANGRLPFCRRGRLGTMASCPPWSEFRWVRFGGSAPKNSPQASPSPYPRASGRLLCAQFSPLHRTRACDPGFLPLRGELRESRPRPWPREGRTALHGVLMAGKKAHEELHTSFRFAKVRNLRAVARERGEVATRRAPLPLSSFWELCAGAQGKRGRGAR